MHFYTVFGLYNFFSFGVTFCVGVVCLFACLFVFVCWFECFLFQAFLFGYFVSNDCCWPPHLLVIAGKQLQQREPPCVMIQMFVVGWREGDGMDSGSPQGPSQQQADAWLSGPGVIDGKKIFTMSESVYVTRLTRENETTGNSSRRLLCSCFQMFTYSHTAKACIPKIKSLFQMHL